MEGGKPLNPEKNTSKGEDEYCQQSIPTYDAGSGNRTRSILAGGEHSHHRTIPAHQMFTFFSKNLKQKAFVGLKLKVLVQTKRKVV